MPYERRTYFTYIMGSLTGTLYIGVTSNLHKRIFEHRFHRIEGFTDNYDVERLLYWESFEEVQQAAAARSSSKAGGVRRRSR
jgi:putative endonuclease